MSSFFVFSGLLLSSLVTLVVCDFNYTKCPAYWELQSAAVATSFSLDLMSGQFYEIFGHDYFQDPICPKRRCSQTVKSYDLGIGQYGQILDNFTLVCYGQQYIEPIYDNITDIRGFVWMFWPSAPTSKWVYPDTFIAVSESTIDIGYGEQYEWLIEFQCMDKKILPGVTKVYYIGINAYAYLANPPQSLKDEMLSTMKQQGLSPYLESNLFFEVDQTNCTYPW